MVAAADPVLARYRDWLRSEVVLAGVTVVTGADVTVADVRDARGRRGGPRHRTGVVTARGRRREPGAYPTRAPRRARRRVRRRRRRVAILGGGKPGLTLALALRARGAAVTVVEPTAVFGTELGLPGRWRMVADAEAAGDHAASGTPP